MGSPPIGWTLSTRLRQAEWYVADGNAQGAATLLPSLPLVEPRLDEPAQGSPARSPLLSPQRYQRHLVAGYQRRAHAEWDEAVAEFRWALALGGPYLRPAEHQAYGEALARQTAATDGATSSLIDAASLFALAEAWDEAQEALTLAGQSAAWESLPPPQQARWWLTQGLVAQAAGEIERALAAFQQASTLALDWRLPRLYELQLLDQTGQEARYAASAAALAQLGPSHRLEQGVVVHDRTLVGYDVEDERLEAGGPLTLWLWWQADPVAGAIRVGEEWVQPQRVVNLAPNPAFSWGVDSQGLPLGYASRYATSGPGGVHLQGEAENPTLRLDYEGVLSIRTFPIPVAPDALYLTAARVQPARGTVALGRKCFTPDYPAPFHNHLWGSPVEPKQVVAEVAAAGSAPEEWRTIANLSLPLHNQAASYCQLYLEATNGAALVDDLIFARLSVPPEISLD